MYGDAGCTHSEARAVSRLEKSRSGIPTGNAGGKEGINASVNDFVHFCFCFSGIPTYVIG